MSLCWCFLSVYCVCSVCNFNYSILCVVYCKFYSTITCIVVEYKNKVFAAVYNAEPMSAEEIFEKCKSYADRLLGFATDTTEFLHESIADGKSILFEGAQGSLLDIDHGTFPFVTSSNSSSLGMPAGCGVPAKIVDKFIGYSSNTPIAVSCAYGCVVKYRCRHNPVFV